MSAAELSEWRIKSSLETNSSTRASRNDCCPHLCPCSRPHTHTLIHALAHAHARCVDVPRTDRGKLVFARPNSAVDTNAQITGLVILLSPAAVYDCY